MAKKHHAANGDTPGPLQQVRHAPPDDGPGWEAWPNLLACLHPVWREGRCVRKDGNLRVRVLGSVYEITLECPSEGVQCSMRVASLTSVLDAMEAALRSGEAVWVPDWASRKRLDRTAAGK